jgi:hypothetical protein
VAASQLVDIYLAADTSCAALSNKLQKTSQKAYCMLLNALQLSGHLKLVIGRDLVLKF